MRIANVISHQNQNLVFNLDWLPLLGDASRAANRARRLGASHYIVSGKPAAALGLAYGLRSKKYWSASDLFAQLHPHGTQVCLINLGQDNWHLLACHEGVVLVHADRSYQDKTAAESYITDLSQTYPSLNKIIVADKNKFFSELLQIGANSPYMHKVRRLIWRYLLAFLVVLGLMWLSWPISKASGSNFTEAEHQQAWEQALNNFYANNQIHGYAGTTVLLNSINLQPIHIAGWDLVSISCNASVIAQQWLCLSEYQRKGFDADNKGFLSLANKEWQLEFPNLYTAKAKWQMNIPSLPIDPFILPNTKKIESEWSSDLQYVLPAFNTLRLTAPEIIKIPVPMGADGKELTVPHDLPKVAARKLQLEGPLRSAVLLKKMAFAIAWKKAVVRYKPGVQPSSKVSSLTIQLEGEVYENRS